ncbi:hypothetical protein ISTM_398 [Insectomime virus]|uniref:Uncharacterized protein n=1 Tax=Tunisvirus fontaine2 TaxID=1421067 RepID=V9SFM6_9VIRU|nr:hypothetical protein D1R32_gp404 [Tunisvirus fontaine2]AHA46296.1 hypothetical protein ISTM_398 [Insectomime virus]AHC55121.1 hypothetical protein TNS_ORF403 [Tunisvirus fontaine2]
MRFPKTFESYSHLLQRCRQQEFREWLLRSGEMSKGRRVALLASLLEGIFLFDDVGLLRLLSETGDLVSVHSSANGKVKFELKGERNHNFTFDVLFAQVCVDTDCVQVHKWMTQELGLWVYISENTPEFLEMYGKFLL